MPTASILVRVIAAFVKPQSAIGYAEAVERRRGKTRRIAFHLPESRQGGE
jgi:hypothetical protein